VRRSGGLIVDLFAGGGGASTGIEAATGRPVSVAINHSPTAIAVHRANHPGTKHYTTDIFEVDPVKATGGRPVELLWASPDCSDFSIAKGGKPRSQGIRSLAEVVIQWAELARPRVIFTENVREFTGWGPLDAHGYRIPEREGELFHRWRVRLELLGYEVAWRVLDASEYGAPTRRKRVFIVARCDGQPIAWPEPTHGPGRAPFRTAAECIDWSLPCPSIFERERPLAEKTLQRIAAGIRKFVLESSRPFVLKVNHGGGPERGSRVESLDSPLSTVTAARRGHALVAPTLIQTSYGERPGQRPRYLDLHEPLGTVVAGGTKHALVTAFLAKHFGDPGRTSGGGRVVGQELVAPVGTITARDHHSLVTSTLVKLRGECAGASLDAPAPTITAGGTHLAEVRAFLAAYYGGDSGQGLDEPLRTVVTRDRFGLVVVDGIEHAITDIGMRMLEPHELLRAQFGRFAEGYDLSHAKTKSAQVRLIGNSVCPEVAEALVRANIEANGQREAA
jgi:DNA (cytosine-5)-methyltransferase 1